MTVLFKVNKLTTSHTTSWALAVIRYGSSSFQMAGCGPSSGGLKRPFFSPHPRADSLGHLHSPPPTPMQESSLVNEMWSLLLLPLPRGTTAPHWDYPPQCHLSPCPLSAPSPLSAKHQPPGLHCVLQACAPGPASAHMTYRTSSS